MIQVPITLQGYYIGTDKVLYTNINFYCSRMIPVNAGDEVYIYNSITSEACIPLVFYDENYTSIDYDITDKDSFIYSIAPQNAKYVIGSSQSKKSIMYITPRISDGLYNPNYSDVESYTKLDCNENGYYNLQNNGDLVSQKGFKSIKINAIDTSGFLYLKCATNSKRGNSAWSPITFYDSSDELIGNAGTEYEPYIYQIPDGTKKIGFTFREEEQYDDIIYYQSSNLSKKRREEINKNIPDVVSEEVSSILQDKTYIRKVLEIDGYYISSDNKIAGNASFAITLPFKVKEGDRIVNNTYSYNSIVSSIAYYDENFNYLNSSFENESDVPDSACYAICSGNLKDKSITIISNNYDYNSFAKWQEITDDDFIIIGYIENNTGNIILGNNQFRLTDKIPVSSKIITNKISMGGIYCAIAVYDINDKCLFTIKDYTVLTFISDKRAAYIRFCLRDTQANIKIKLERNVIINKSHSNLGFNYRYESFKSFTETNYELPFAIKNGNTATFSAKLDNGAANSITLSRGYKLILNGSSLTYYANYNSHPEEVEEVAFNAGLKDYVKLVVREYFEDSNNTIEIRVCSNGLNQVIKKQYSAGIGTNYEIESDIELKDVSISLVNEQIKKDIWLLGDSYFDFLLSAFKRYNIASNCMLCGAGGATSSFMFSNLIKLLRMRVPKIIIWALGMNDNTLTDYTIYVEQFLSLCRKNGIVPILYIVPTVPDHSKEEIKQYILDSKERYIDAYNAVGANSNGEWYENYLGDDNVHPTDTGSEAIVEQYIVDVPELIAF